jgi:hypothetical protein
MTAGVITDAQQLDRDRLSGMLLRSGTLRSGAVRGIECEAGAGAWSRHARLRVRYEPGSVPGPAHAAPPERLFLKMCQGTFGRSEVDFYTRDYAGLAGTDALPLLHCHDAAYDPAGPAYHLLLDDVSDTHEPCWDRPATPAYLDALADAVAALHAARPAGRLAELGAVLPGPLQIDRYVAHCRAGLEPLLASLPGNQRRHGEALLRAVFEHGPGLMRQRCADPRGLCLVHGDINPGNILASRDLSSPGAPHRPLYLIDRQPFDWSLTVWLGVSDLAYLMFSHWPTPQRQQHQQALLRRYHQGLAARGMDAGSWPQLWDDYRLCALQAALVAVEWCVLEPDRERMRWLWTVQLQRALDAMQELDCAALWRPA